MKRYLFAFLISFLITLTFGFALTSRIHEPTPGAIDLELPGRCEFTYFDTRLQPFNTITFGCPHLDRIRIWPLPIKYPWFEDWWENRPNSINI